jgi:hypothetical protein
VEELAVVPLVNSRGEGVGELAARRS